MALLWACCLECAIQWVLGGMYLYHVDLCSETISLDSLPNSRGRSGGAMCFLHFSSLRRANGVEHLGCKAPRIQGIGIQHDQLEPEEMALALDIAQVPSQTSALALCGARSLTPQVVMGCFPFRPQKSKNLGSPGCPLRRGRVGCALSAVDTMQTTPKETESSCLFCRWEAA